MIAVVKKKNVRLCVSVYLHSRSNDSEKPGKASETRAVLGKLHAAGKSPEITCENAGNPGKIAADTRNSVGDATGKALSAAEITCETAGNSAKGKSMKSEADLRVNSVKEATETDARSAFAIGKSSFKLTETDHAWAKKTDYNDRESITKGEVRSRFDSGSRKVFCTATPELLQSIQLEVLYGSLCVIEH